MICQQGGRGFGLPAAEKRLIELTGCSSGQFGDSQKSVHKSAPWNFKGMCRLTNPAGGHDSKLLLSGVCRLWQLCPMLTEQLLSQPGQERLCVSCLMCGVIGGLCHEADFVSAAVSVQAFRLAGPLPAASSCTRHYCAHPLFPVCSQCEQGLQKCSNGARGHAGGP